MLGYKRLADLTADSMVQCLMVPSETFLQLYKANTGVYTRAWQATAAQLAAQHHHILGEHKQLAPLNMFFRCGRRFCACAVCRITKECANQQSFPTNSACYCLCWMRLCVVGTASVVHSGGYLQQILHKLSGDGGRCAAAV
jgi:hypothetical protein